MLIDFRSVFEAQEGTEFVGYDPIGQRGQRRPVFLGQVDSQPEAEGIFVGDGQRVGGVGRFDDFDMDRPVGRRGQCFIFVLVFIRISGHIIWVIIVIILATLSPLLQ